MSTKPKHQFYGHKDEHGFKHIFPSIGQVNMCGDAQVVPLTVSECKTGEYHGWIHKDKTVPSMIYKHEKALEICFVYGIQAAIDAGEGRRVKLKVVETKTKTE